MKRSRSLVLVGVVLSLVVCTVCAVSVGFWYAYPALRAALAGATPVPPISNPTPAAAAPAQPPAANTTAPTTPAQATPVVTLAPGTVAPMPRVEPTLPAYPARPGAPAPSATAAALPTAAVATPEPDIVARLTQIQPPVRDPYVLTERLKKVGGPIPRVVNRTPDPLKIGDRATFWINDESNKGYYETVARLRYLTPHVALWVEEGVEVSDDAVRRSADIFENKIYPTTRQYFGEEHSPGIDGDPRLYILNGKFPDVGGYYSSADGFPKVVNPYSNEHEMFYINVQAFPIGTAGYEATIAHEFQHMIHAAYDRSETSWINEGLSELAARLNGYGDSKAMDSFLANPNTQLNAWSEAQQVAPHYGAAYLFATYTFDRFGAPFIRDLVAEKRVGIEGYDAVLKKHNAGVTFEQVFKDWLIANYLDNTRIERGRYGYPESEVRIRPRAVVNLERGAPREGQVTQYGAEYLRVTGSGPATVQLEGATTVRLVPTRAQSGQYMLYSNRGDYMASNATRAFDLTGVTKATLQFGAWYNIEEDYDYAYVEVSTNDGQTWDLLKTTTTKDTNPKGHAFGPGLTGDSGPKGSPEWTAQTADLTPYAGKRVLIRFEMITDDAVNLVGLAVDDVQIPELNYREDFERGDGGWKMEGFLRTNALLPQRYLVQVIEQRRDAPKVVEAAVGPDGKARITLDGLGRDYNEAIIVVSAAAPTTTETARYTVRVE